MTQIALWEAMAMVFVACAGTALGVTIYYGMRMTDLQRKLEKVEYDNKQLRNSINTLVGVLQRMGHDELVFNATGDVNIGGDVVGQDKTEWANR